MQGLRKRILAELFLTPSTIIPLTLGMTLVMLSEMLGGLAAFGGLISILIGVGSFLTNLVFNMDAVAKKVIKQMQDEKNKERDVALDALDRKLVKDRDPRDQNALRNLRALYNGFADDMVNGKIEAALPPSILAQIDEIFNNCVAQLGKQYEMWEMSNKVTGSVKDRLLTQRDDIVAEVEKTVENLAGIISEVRVLGLKAKKGELSKLQTRLQSQLDAAKATEALVQSLDGDNMDRFAEYEKR